MSTEANTALVRRFFERVVNRGELGAMKEFLAPDFVSHEELPPGIPSGREGAKQLVSMMRRAFPDLHATIEDEIAEGDKVVARITFSGTHQGAFMGIQRTGRQVAYPVIDILRIADEQVVEHWAVADMMGLMQQLSGDRWGRNAGQGSPEREVVLCEWGTLRQGRNTDIQRKEDV